MNLVGASWSDALPPNHRENPAGVGGEVDWMITTSMLSRSSWEGRDSHERDEIPSFPPWPSAGIPSPGPLKSVRHSSLRACSSARPYFPFLLVLLGLRFWPLGAAIQWFRRIADFGSRLGLACRRTQCGPQVRASHPIAVPETSPHIPFLAPSATVIDSSKDSARQRDIHPSPIDRLRVGHLLPRHPMSLSGPSREIPPIWRSRIFGYRPHQPLSVPVGAHPTDSYPS
jgi:hypothetical protein